jgi:hypothetical protein
MSKSLGPPTKLKFLFGGMREHTYLRDSLQASIGERKLQTRLLSINSNFTTAYFSL